MTDGLNNPETVTSQNQEINSTTSDSPVSQQQVQAPAEKMLTQSEVNELVRGAKVDGYKKAVSEYQAKQPEMPQQHVQQTQQNAYQGQEQYANEKQLTPEQVKEIAAQQWASEQHKAYMDNVASKLANDFSNTRTRYADFDTVMGKYKYPDEILVAASQLPNAGDVIYELGKNPGKLAILKASRDDFNLLSDELGRLSQSLKQNEEAKSQSLPRDPLSQVQASNVGTDNGSRSIKDFKKLFKA